MDAPVALETIRALPRTRSQLLPALLIAQHAEGYVSDTAIELIAGHLQVTVNDVESVATSYPELRRLPHSPNVARVCTGVSCLFAGAGAIQRALARHAESGGPDVEIENVPCLFLCAMAPVVEIGGVRRGRCDSDGAVAMLKHEVEPV